MDLRQITEDYTVSPQISVDDVNAIADAGYRSLMCNRPDGEEFGQPDYDALAQAAQTRGLEVAFVPISSGRVSQEQAQAFDDALRDMPKPILAYCRTGTRCTMLWTISQIGKRDAQEIIQLTSAAGYDMSGIVRQLGG